MDAPRNRKIAFVLLGLLFALLVLELGSFLILSAVEGRWMPPGAVRAERGAISASGVDVARPGEEDAVVRQLLATSVIHPYLGFVRDPASVELGNAHPQSHEFGFIQNRHSLFLEPSPERVVVAVTGGSVARSVAIHGDALYHALAKSRRFAAKKVHVLSLATGGYKQPQQLISLNYLLALGAHFDVVINLDGFNDVVLAPARNLPNETFLFFPYHWALRVGHLDLDDRRRIGELTYLRQRRRAWAQAFGFAPASSSLTAALLWKSFDNVWASRVIRAEEALETGRNDGDDYQAKGPRRTYEDEDEMYRDLATVWSRSSRQMHLLCRGMGIEYHHFLQPNQYVPDSKPLSAEEKSEFWQANHPYRAPAVQGYPWLVRLGRELREQGVAFHDLTGIFRERPETLYRDTCCHLNPAGNELLAEAIARAIDEAEEPSRAGL